MGRYMEIKRDLYLKKLIDHEGNGLIKIITGIRRCGKSYLLNIIFTRHLTNKGVSPEHIIKASLDDYGNKDLRDPDNLYRYIKEKVKDDSVYYILLDEIQLVNDFEGVLNGLLHLPNVDIYVTGSNSRFLSSDIATEFRGRGDEIRVYPLSFSEFYSALSPNTPFSDAWIEYATYGGMPLALAMKSDADKSKYLKDLFSITYLADIVNRYNLKGNAEINELTEILASSIGSLNNPNRLMNTFNSEKNLKLSSNTISSYLDYLEDSFLIEKAIKYDIKGKKHISSLLKYYFVDTGLRNAILSFRQIEYSHIMENIIYNELRLNGYSVDVGSVEVNTKENGISKRKQLEVDFVANMGSRKYYIQAAYHIDNEEKLKQEEASLLKINDSFKKMIIINDAIKIHYNEHGILMSSLSDFLMDPQGVLSF